MIKCRNVIMAGRREPKFKLIVILASLLLALLIGDFRFGANIIQRVQALRITKFYVPPYVPITLPTRPPTPPTHNSYNQPTISQPSQTISYNSSNFRLEQFDLLKPILFDCDYDYKPEEDSKLTIRWFRNKESEPFYQWLPELNSRHFADWIRPLVNVTFESDPYDPMKRYRSILIKRLNMNLTGQYSCIVSSLAGQDMRQSSLIVYKPPESFQFEYKIFPMAANLLQQFNSNPIGDYQQHRNYHQTESNPLQQQHNNYNRQLNQIEQQQQQQQPTISPTQFKGWNQPGFIVRPANNHKVIANLSQSVRQNQSPAPMTSQSLNETANTKIVYTHDGRPIRRKSKRQLQDWQRQRRLQPSSSDIQRDDGGGEKSPIIQPMHTIQMPRVSQNILQQQQQLYQSQSQRFSIQLHHFRCQANQVSPRPVMVLTVKRDSDSIAQYLHESSSVSIRPYQVFLSGNKPNSRLSKRSIRQIGLVTSEADDHHLRNQKTSIGNAKNDDDNKLLDPTKVPRAKPNRRSLKDAAVADLTTSQLAKDQVDGLQQDDDGSNRNERDDHDQNDEQQQDDDYRNAPVTLYNITVSATVALNVSLAPLSFPGYWPTSGALVSEPMIDSATRQQYLNLDHHHQQQQQHFQSNQNNHSLVLPPGINTVLLFKRGQRMSFECHLEITGTEYEDIKRININEEEVFQFADVISQQQQRTLKANRAGDSQTVIFGMSSRYGINLDPSNGGKSSAISSPLDNLAKILSSLVAILIFKFAFVST